MAELADDVAMLGHNNPPADPEPTPFDFSKEEIDGLYMEAENWLDGEPVTTQQQADAIGKLVADLRAAGKRADQRRTTENEPFDKGKAEVQARYNPLIQKDRGKVDRAILTCKEALAPFLAAQEAEKRAKAEAARREAEEKQRAAEEALRASRAADLASRAEAEHLVQEAKKAEKAAARAEKDKASAGGGTRAMTIRHIPKPFLKDAREAARHYWVERRSDLETFLQSLAEADVRAGKRSIPGFEIIEEVAIQ